MCTVTWSTRADGYDLFFNRDEHRARGTAIGPLTHTRPGARVIAPLDPDGGGTWLAVNEHGLSHCLLNYYAADAAADARGQDAATIQLEAADQVPTTAMRHSDRRVALPGRAPRSRGLLVLELSDSASVEESAERLEQTDYGAYLPFILLVFAPGCEPRGYLHTGAAQLEAIALRPPLTTSSFQPAEVRRRRSRVYREMLAAYPDPVTALERFHRSELPEPGPFAVAMSRDEAMTVSLSHVSVDTRRALFRYAPGPPAETPFSERLELERTWGP